MLTFSLALCLLLLLLAFPCFPSVKTLSNSSAKYIGSLSAAAAAAHISVCCSWPFFHGSDAGQKCHQHGSGYPWCLPPAVSLFNNNSSLQTDWRRSNLKISRQGDVSKSNFLILTWRCALPNIFKSIWFLTWGLYRIWPFHVIAENFWFDISRSEWLDLISR